MDAREFKQRFMPFHRRLYRVGYHLTGNAQDAEDLLQDTYLKLWQKRDDLKEEAITEAYLVTLMQNLFRDKRRLKRIVTSEDIAHSKPAPDCYLKAAELLGVFPADCIAFEDSFNGLKSALAAGTTVVALTTAHPAAEVRDLSHFQIPDYTEALSRLGLAD